MATETVIGETSIHYGCQTNDNISCSRLMVQNTTRTARSRAYQSSCRHVVILPLFGNAHRLNRLPIDIIVKADARIWPYNLHLSDNKNPRPNGYAAIIRPITNPIITLESEFIISVISLDKHSNIQTNPDETFRGTPKRPNSSIHFYPPDTQISIRTPKSCQIKFKFVWD